MDISLEYHKRIISIPDSDWLIKIDQGGVVKWYLPNPAAAGAYQSELELKHGLTGLSIYLSIFLSMILEKGTWRYLPMGYRWWESSPGTFTSFRFPSFSHIWPHWFLDGVKFFTNFSPIFGVQPPSTPRALAHNLGSQHPAARAGNATDGSGRKRLLASSEARFWNRLAVKIGCNAWLTATSWALKCKWWKTRTPKMMVILGFAIRRGKASWNVASRKPYREPYPILPWLYPWVCENDQDFNRLSVAEWDTPR